MPGIYAHYAFGFRALKASGRQGEEMLDTHREAFLLGCQGPDFCYYHMMRPGVDTDAWMNLAKTLHSQKIGQMMREALMLTLKVKNNAVRAYFLGYITHYALDAYTHPYVFHHCNQKRYHLQFESAIDRCLMLRDGFDPSRTPLYTLLGNVEKAQLKAITVFWHTLLQNVYNTHISQRELEQALTEMRRAFRLSLSRFGIKKRILETAAGRWGLKDDLLALFYADVHIIKDDYLNEKRQPWSLPWDKSQERDLSFTMIEEEASAFACMCLEAVLSCWEGKNTLAGTLGCIGQMSMLTGEDWHMEYDVEANVSERFFPGDRQENRREGERRIWQH